MHLVDDAQVVRLQALGLERASNSTPIANAHREWCRVKAIQTQVLCEQNSDPYDQVKRLHKTVLFRYISDFEVPLSVDGRLQTKQCEGRGGKHAYL